MKCCAYCLSFLEDNVNFCAKCGKRTDYIAPDYHLRPGTLLLGRFYVGASLGEGGFGITYVGRDAKLNIPVAIKEYYPNGFVNRNATVSAEVSCGNTLDRVEFFKKGRERFLKEAQTLAAFANERGIVSIRDFFEANNTAYIVMELLEGETLRDYLKRMGVMTPDATLEMLMPVMQTLKHVHKQGLIHRDISPDNIMLTKNGIKLLDFGAARDTNAESHKSLSVMLKPGYAPEEQYRSKGEQGAWTDVYSLCATMYRCITGKRPDDSTQRLVEDEVLPPSALGVSITPVFENALMTGMSVFAKNRPQDIDALLALFDREKVAAIPVPIKADEEATVLVGSNASVPVPPVKSTSVPTYNKTDVQKAPSPEGTVNPPPAQGQRTKRSKLPLVIILVLLLGGVSFLVAALLFMGGDDGERAPEITVKIDTSSVTLKVGEGVYLQGYAEDDNGKAYTVEWSTDNEHVAGVIDGYVVANNPGTANIYATCEGEKAVCEVTVTLGIIYEETSQDESEDVSEDSSEESLVSSELSESTEVYETTTYTVTVEDQNGNGISGVRVEILTEDDYPTVSYYALTGYDGVASWIIEERNYSISISTLPEGYDYASDITELILTADNNEATVVLEKLKVDESSSYVQPEESSSPDDSSSNVVVTPNKTNYALGKSYTVTCNGLEITDDRYLSLSYGNFADFDLTKLTDGVTAKGSDFNEYGQAPNVSINYVGTNALYEFIIDLGESYDDISSITFRGVRDGATYGNNRGFNEALTMIYVGESVGSWSSKLATTFKSTPIPGAPLVESMRDPDIKNIENFDYTFTFNQAQKGRYVRIIACSEVYVLQFDEIEIWN